MIDLNRRTIGGLDFEAVRFTIPINHWRVKLPNGEVLSTGIFDSSSRPRMWASMEYTLKRLGQERFISGFNL